MTQTVERMLPLYEGKMIHQFDHRWATHEPDGTVRDVTMAEKRDPGFAPQPRYWVREEVVLDRLGNRAGTEWLAGYRWISNVTNERTFIATTFPCSGVGNSLPVILGPTDEVLLFVTLSSTFAFDYCAWQMLGGQNVTFGTVKQLPMLMPSLLDEETPWPSRETLRSRLLRLRGRLMDWSNADRRRNARCELDAAMFQLFGLIRDDVDYVMETFPIVKRKDEAEFGRFRTKEMILDVYDASSERSTRASRTARRWTRNCQGGLIPCPQIGPDGRG